MKFTANSEAAARSNGPPLEVKSESGNQQMTLQTRSYEEVIIHSTGNSDLNESPYCPRALKPLLDLEKEDLQEHAIC